MGFGHRAFMRALVVAGLGMPCFSGVPDRAALASDTTASRLGPLDSNSAIWLPPPRIEGEGLDAFGAFAQNGPGVRDFSRRFAYSRTRRVAYYAGGNHCAPHRFNDVWRYDLASNTWTMLFRPEFNGCRASAEVTDRHCTLRDGVVEARNGGPCNPGHTWWGLTFDDHAGRMLWMNAGTSGRDGYIERHRLGGRTISPPTPPLWSFDPERRRWSFVRTEGPHPKPMFGGFLEYLPDERRTVWFGNEWTFSGMWSLPSGGSRWRDMRPNGRSKGYGKDTVWPRAETIAAYSPVHRKIFAIASATGHVHLYDLDRNRWRILREGRSAISPNRVLVAFDSVNEVFLYWNGEYVLVFDPDGARWEMLSPKGPRFGAQPAGYFDPDRNVLVGYNGSRIWVYRYRRRDPA